MSPILYVRLIAILAATSGIVVPARAGSAFTPLPAIAAHFQAEISLKNSNGYTTLSAPHKQIVFVPDVRRITLDGLVLHMNAPFLVIGGTGQVSGTDVDTILQPLLDELAGSPVIQATPVIVLDPGHGGEDSGALGAAPGLAEKNIVLQIALRVREQLEETGLDVRLTRESDHFVSLEERADLANRWGADLFVSIHVNSSPNAQASGIETFVMPAAGFSSTAEGSKVAGPYPGNANDAENTRLAYYVHKGLISRTRAEDRGVRHARYEVLREVHCCPALLAECGFISNADDAWLLRKETYRDQVAGGIASGIMTYVSRRLAAMPAPTISAERLASHSKPAVAPQPPAPLPATTTTDTRSAEAAPKQTREEDPAEPEAADSTAKPPAPSLPPSALIQRGDADSADRTGEGKADALEPATNPIPPSTVKPIE